MHTRIFGVTVLMAVKASHAVAADQPSILVTVKSDGQLCVVQHHTSTCAALPNLLKQDLALASGVTIRVSPEDCGETAMARADSVAATLKKAGFSRVMVVGFLTEPNKKCTS